MDEWFCVVSRPQQEPRAASELANQDFEVFLPILDGKPMFPRYLFTSFDRESSHWGKIKHTRGCLGLLKNGHKPSPVPEPVIMALKAYRPPEKVVEGQTHFEPGQRVKIVNGPGEGLEGLFDGDAKRRTIAFLKIMGKRVEVPRRSIRAA